MYAMTLDRMSEIDGVSKQAAQATYKKALRKVHKHLNAIGYQLTLNEVEQWLEVMARGAYDYA